MNYNLCSHSLIFGIIQKKEIVSKAIGGLLTQKVTSENDYKTHI